MTPVLRPHASDKNWLLHMHLHSSLLFLFLISWMYSASQGHVIIVKQKLSKSARSFPDDLSLVTWGKKLGRETLPHLRLSKAEKASLEATSLSRIITVSHVLPSIQLYVIYVGLRYCYFYSPLIACEQALRGALVAGCPAARQSVP